MNKKIKNATKVSYNGIQFKSKFECSVYEKLKEEGFNPLYEYEKIELVQGFKPRALFFRQDLKKTGGNYRNLKLDLYKIRGITYTPDFAFTYMGVFIYMEVKGFENDTYSIKRKLFRKYLEESESENVLFFEIKTMKNLKQAIKIIKDYATK